MGYSQRMAKPPTKKIVFRLKGDFEPGKPLPPNGDPGRVFEFANGSSAKVRVLEDGSVEVEKRAPRLLPKPRRFLTRRQAGTRTRTSGAGRGGAG